MKKSTTVIILNIFLVLGFVLFQTVQREKLIKNGELVLFKLRPVDPRSLMQGDYMILRYDVTSARHLKDSIPKNGYLVFKTDINGVAEKVRFQKELSPLSENERLVKYLKNNRDITIGSESYFFQEGTGDKYANAKYGAMKVDRLGNSTVVGLCGDDKKVID